MFRPAIQVSGPDLAPALLLLPGQANSHRWWDGLREPFAQHHRTITFDYRGTGGTDASEGDWTTATFADDAAAVLDQVGVERAAVYGASMGGKVAQRLALDHPGRVSALVLACTSSGGRRAVHPVPDVQRMLTERDRERRRANLLELFYSDGRTTSNLLGDPGLTPADARRHLRVSARHDAWDRLPEIAVPTLVLHGGDDRMAPAENAALLGERIPGAQVRITAGGRHGFFDEFAADVTPAVLTFLARSLQRGAVVLVEPALGEEARDHHEQGGDEAHEAEAGEHDQQFHGAEATRSPGGSSRGCTRTAS